MNRFLFTLVAGVFVSTAAQASAISLMQGTTEAATPQVFAEAQNRQVTSGQVDVDYLVGSNLNLGDTVGGVTNFTNSLALEGGVYDSFMVHFDPVGEPSDPVSTSATFGFAGKIVALIVSNGSSLMPAASKLLNSSDAVFGAPGGAYETNLGRRSESNDLMQLLDANTLAVSFETRHAYVDNIRVITQAAAVPLPASLSLMLAGVAGLSAMRRKRRSA